MMLFVAALLAGAQPSPMFTVAGEPFAPADILDARGLPDVAGGAAILVTMTPAAAVRLEKVTAPLVGKEVVVALEGKTIMQPTIIEPLTAGTLTLSGFATLDEAVTTAKRISGKPPVREEFEE